MKRKCRCKEHCNIFTLPPPCTLFTTKHKIFNSFLADCPHLKTQYMYSVSHSHFSQKENRTFRDLLATTSIIKKNIRVHDTKLPLRLICYVNSTNPVYTYYNLKYCFLIPVITISTEKPFHTKYRSLNKCSEMRT